MIRRLLSRYKFLLLAIVFVCVGIVIESNYFNTTTSKHQFARFQTVVNQKIEETDSYCNKILNLTDSADFQTYEKFRKNNKNIFSNENVSFIVFSNKELVYWSNNAIPTNFTTLSNSKQLLFSGNAWYLISHAHKKTLDVFVLTFIKSQYSFENKYITNKFHSDFNINNNTQIFTDLCDDTYPIYDKSGDFLFSLSITANRSNSPLQCYVALLLYAFALICLLIFLNECVVALPKKSYKIIANVILLVVFACLRMYMVSEVVPYIGHVTPLFDANIFSTFFAPSLGDLLIDSILLTFFMLQIARGLRNFELETKKHKTIIFIAFSLFIALYWAICQVIFISLGVDANVNLKLYNILAVNGLGFAVYTEFALLLFLLFLLLYSFFERNRMQCSIKDCFLLVFIVGVVSCLCSLLIVHSFWVFTVYILLVVILFLLYAQTHVFNENVLKFSVLLLSVLFVEIVVSQYVRMKDIQQQKQMAVELANEKDPIAESFLTGIYKESRADQTLRQMIQQADITDVEIRNYLQNKYFSGFLKQYELECTVCGTDSTFETANQLTNCDKYFSNMLETSGESLSEANYYYVNNQDGNITYFDSIQYHLPHGSITKLYIELHSQTSSLNFGYPAILIDGDVPLENTTISSAKYKNDVLISKRGRCPYSQNLQLLDKTQKKVIDKNFYLILDEQHAMRHVAYKINDQFTVLVSERMIQIGNYVMWFPYIFLYFLLFSLLFSRAYFASETKNVRSLSLQIKHSLIGLLIGAFTLITIFGLYFINTRNEQQQRSFWEDKLLSVANAVLQEYKDDAEISSIDDFQKMLASLSEIYGSDVNFYSTTGNLLASSRPEIFQYRLQNEKMSPSAYNFLISKSHSQYSSEESIGNLSYLSSYVSITNSQNRILGYLNLPNFSNQNEFQQQFAGVIVSMINLMVILMLIATAISVFIAQKITDPLVVLQNKMKQVAVGSNNEKIDIQAPNELEDLIHNYNSMIDQLSISANKLAQAERESAWKEMARQIAHEIKNPLTPMKLSMQLLNRSWDEKDEKFEKRLKSISKTMIEQIDTLAETATSFSDFAKLSMVVLEPLELTEVLQNCVTLFSQEENLQITTDIPENQIFVIADKEKTTRLFNNLVKNAIQAIPSSRQGKIELSLATDVNYAIVAVKDNGRGIDEEAKQHIFELHFTTKETGNGFGLAICKNIVESSGGSIWFETIYGEGSTFFVKLPLQKD